MNATVIERPKSRSVESGFGYARYRSRLLLQRTTSTEVTLPDSRQAGERENSKPDRLKCAKGTITTVRIFGTRPPVIKRPLTSRDVRPLLFPVSLPITARAETVTGDINRAPPAKLERFRRTSSCGACRVPSTGNVHVVKLVRSQSRCDSLSTGVPSMVPPRTPSRRPQTAASKYSRALVPSSQLSVSSRERMTKSSSDGMDNNITDISSDVEDARPANPRAPGRTFATPITQMDLRRQNIESRVRSSVNSVDKEVYDKCKAWVTTLPDRFSGLHNVISIPTDTVPSENS